ncbi:hypothetical protein AALP_AA6G071700 [Arabis alpina]|uniref:Ubiquitin-like domain-containing protein n=1 Tax=Arabis alpina TaxID=50452 RepID=A0A087GMM7_ARAAL|nr:hypothetical protein AALP_AA6G071700 [Arabis alpina]
MKLNVEIITGTFVDTEVSENATVKELKEKISTEMKLPVKRLILVVGNEEERRMLMDDGDEMILRDLGIREDTHMYLFFMHLDLVSKEEGSQEGDDVSVEEISSEAESRRIENGEEEEDDDKAKIHGKDEDKEMNIEEEDKDEKVEHGEEKEKDREETKDDTEVSDNATVKELMEEISAEVKLPVKRLILVVGNEEDRRVLMDDEDEMMLKDLGVREDSHVYLFFKYLDLVSKEGRSQEGDDVSMEEISSEAESRRRENGEEKAKIDVEDEDKETKNEEEDRDEKVEIEEKEKDHREETMDDDNVEDETRDVGEGDKKEES